MRHVSARGAVSRPTAMLLGVGCSLLLVGVVLLMTLWRGRPGGAGGVGGAGAGGMAAGSAGSGGESAITPGAPPVDVGDVGRTGRAFNEMLDKDGVRVKQHVAWREMNPLPKGQYEVIEPRAWLYLKDGKTLEVQAATGRLRFTPESKQKRPEAGNFEGGVLVRMYGPGVLDAAAVKEAMSGARGRVTGGDAGNGAAGGAVEGAAGSEGAAERRSAPLTSTPPILIGYAESLSFDTLTNEYSTVDRVMVSTEEIESEFGGLRVIYNEVAGRPDLVESTAGFVRLTKGPKKSGESDGRGAGSMPGAGEAGGNLAPGEQAPGRDEPARESGEAAGTAGAAGDGAAKGSASPKIEHYRADFFEAVDLTGRGQAVASDKLLLWVRLVDGKLPEESVRATKEPGPAQGAKQAERTDGADVAGADGGEKAGDPVAEVGLTDAAGGAMPAEPVTGTGPAAQGGTKPAAAPSMAVRMATLRGMPSAAPRPLAAEREDDVILTWSGAASVYALDETPGELKANEVAARFVAEGDRPVLLRDTRRADSAFAMCRVLDYGMTTKDAVLSGESGGSGGEVMMIDPRNGRRAVVERFAINLESGIAQATGGGLLSASKSEGTNASGGVVADLKALIAQAAVTTEQDRTLAWNDQADFVFELNQKSPGDAGIKSIREAMFSGAVVAKDGVSLVSGDFLRATFAPSEKSDTTFARVEVEGNAHGETRDEKKAGEHQTLDADRLDVAFTPDKAGKESDPSVLTAIGNVRGEQVELRTVREENGAARVEPRVTTLTTALLEAQLLTTTNEKGRKRTDVRSAVASKGVWFERSDGVTASGEEMYADMLTKDIEFAGPEVALARGASSVRGTDVRLNGEENSLNVRSAGSIRHTEAGGVAAAGGTEPGVTAAATKLGEVDLTWTISMAFNDSTGWGECTGGAKMVQQKDWLNRTTISAERMGVQLEPAAVSAKRTDEAKKAGTEAPERLLLRAEASGTGDTPETRAKLESREYVEDPTVEGRRRLQRLTYLEARSVVADEEHGVLDVPTSGRALIMDHRVATAPARDGDATSVEGASNPATVIPTSNPRGTTLLGWAGSLRLTRASGLIEMQDRAELTHKPLDPAQQPVKIVADRMEGHLRPKGSAAGGSSAANLSGLERDQLVKAIALGNVLVTTLTEDIRLSAARVEYDADARVLIASAGGEVGESVEYVDTKRGTPVVAKQLIVHLKDDGRHEMQVIEPMPITAPLPK